ncbi:hypothetical protein SAMN05216298_3765 [Glycomyces sambucus]|uniref:Uncharacterized protein n=2 Tax=Glycomyces sambucus TaxID=380244 RepID=A0A1G9JPD1_9ACTN|nr:hypothetical protein SAMN05216298_3765 [Glycomyces sambucus]
MDLLAIAPSEAPPDLRPTPDGGTLRAEMFEFPWLYLGEFTVDIGMRAKVRFLVERSVGDLALHRIRYDEGFEREPTLVAHFTEPAAGPTVWRPVWDGDRLSPSIEARSRAIAR